MFDYGDRLDIPIVFPDYIKHKDIANLFENKGLKAVSAGFCIKEGKTFGESHSLKLSPRAEDENILKFFFRHVR